MNLAPEVLFKIAGMPITDTLVTAWVIAILLIIGGRLLTLNLKIIPGRAQAAAEMFVEVIMEFIESMLPGEGRKYISMIGTIFLFIGAANLSGFIPMVKNPTGDLSTTAAFAIVVFIISHVAGIQDKGLGTYLKGYAEPFFLLTPLNVISELAKPVSHSFRLFGNILGGGIILAIAMNFVPWLVPIPLIAWFDLFVGVIQALIFTMLSIVYIAVQKDS